MSTSDIEVLAGWNVAIAAIKEYGARYADVLLWNRPKTMDQVDFVSGMHQAAKVVKLHNYEIIPEPLDRL